MNFWVVPFKYRFQQLHYWKTHFPKRITSKHLQPVAFLYRFALEVQIILMRKEYTSSWSYRLAKNGAVMVQIQLGTTLVWTKKQWGNIPSFFNNLKLR